MWATSGRPRPLFPDAVTARRGVSGARVSELLADRGSCSVKDSYADVDLAPYGFTELFAARWITAPAADGADDWTTVEDEAGLAQWCLAAGIPALPGVLRDPTVRVCARHVAGTVVGGAILNTSEGVIGVSNVFGDDVWPTLAPMAARLLGRSPTVGDEHGEDLRAAAAAGFVALGPLRIWIRSRP